MIMLPAISESNCMFNTCRAKLVFLQGIPIQIEPV